MKSLKKKIIGFSNDRLSGRLLELGITPGKNLEVIRRAAFGGPCYVKVDSHSYVLRKEELESILLENLEK